MSLSKSIFYISIGSSIAVGGLAFFSVYYTFLAKKRSSNKSIEPAKLISTLSQDEIYIQKAKQRFLDTFLQENVLDKYCTDYNENIDTCFYDISEYKQAVLLEKNDLELSWKRRILLEMTPRGNIIMFYDVYKHGFSYYADNYMPYSILNAVAMKYVLLYRCRHFFLDEQLVPIGYTSPFIALYCKEEDKKNKKTMEEKKRLDDLGIIPLNINIKTGPFAKFAAKTIEPSKQPLVVRQEKFTWLSHILGFTSKKKQTSKQITKPIIVQKALVLPMPEIIKNRMIYLGKCTNFSILSQTQPTITIPKSNQTKQEKISYSTFKSWQNPNPEMFSRT